MDVEETLLALLTHEFEVDGFQLVGLKDEVKVMLVGGTKEEVGGMQREEGEAKWRERIERERRAKWQAKVRIILAETAHLS